VLLIALLGVTRSWSGIARADTDTTSAVAGARQSTAGAAVTAIDGESRSDGKSSMAGVHMEIFADLTEMPRRLLRTRTRLDVKPGEVRLRYPEWIPGVHGPVGPIQNQSGFRVLTIEGKILTWIRDPAQRFCFLVTVPEGVGQIDVFVEYIANQPSTHSKGVDSYGYSWGAIINWNTCTVYPEQLPIATLRVRPHVRLPEGWSWGSSLEAATQDGADITFKPLSYEALVDSPLVTSKNFRTIDLETGESPPVALHLISGAPRSFLPKDDVFDQLSKLTREAVSLLGKAHYDKYHFLLALSDESPDMGLEHLASSLNGAGERDLVDDEKRRDRLAYLLPHEYTHSWCGKYRRPRGMLTPDYHSPKDTRLLWVYEGLTQYLGLVLTVRSGLWDAKHYSETLAVLISDLMHQGGREWRPLVDTTADAYHLRGGSKSWGLLRRNQDYYREGSLMWMGADAIIRNESGGKKSLDDFCSSFFGDVGVEGPYAPFDIPDLVSALNAVHPYDWDAYLRGWVEKTHEELPTKFVEWLGYRLRYTNERTAFLKRTEKNLKKVFVLDSVGLSVMNTGTVDEVVPGSPADKAKMAPGMDIVGVNGFKFSDDRLRDGIADSVVRKNVTFLVLQGEEFREIKVDYSGGSRYLELEKNADRPDRLSEILEPRTGKKKE